MRKSLAALAALGAIATQLPAGVVVVDGQTATNSKPAASKSKSGDLKRVAVGDTKTNRLGGTGYYPQWRAPRGKRYSASVRQHQRNARKARNVRRARAANR